MTEQEVLAKMKESEAAAERGPGHIKITYTYPLKLSKTNPGGHNQADCYRLSTDSLMVGVHTNNMKYAKDNYAATGNKVTKCPNGFDYPTNPEEQGYFWIQKSTGDYYVRAKFENIAPQYKQVSKYFIDGVEVSYQDVVDAFNNGEFTKSAIEQITDQNLFDRHVAVDRITDIKVLVKEELEEGYFSKEDVLPQIAQNLQNVEKDEKALQGMLDILDKLSNSKEFSFDAAGKYTDQNRKTGVTPMNLEKALLNSRGSLQHFITQCENYMPDGEDMFRHILGFKSVAELNGDMTESVNEDAGFSYDKKKYADEMFEYVYDMVAEDFSGVVRHLEFLGATDSELEEVDKAEKAYVEVVSQIMAQHPDMDFLKEFADNFNFSVDDEYTGM